MGKEARETAQGVILCVWLTHFSPQHGMAPLVLRGVVLGPQDEYMNPLGRLAESCCWVPGLFKVKKKWGEQRRKTQCLLEQLGWVDGALASEEGGGQGITQLCL